MKKFMTVRFNFKAVLRMSKPFFELIFDSLYFERDDVRSYPIFLKYLKPKVYDYSIPDDTATSSCGNE